MRLNPAYTAAIELKKVIPQVQLKKTKDNASYCMINLSFNDTALVFAGTSYQPECLAHLSVYQWYNKNETQGLSVFHYTWRGFIENDNGRTSVVLHVYFDKIGRYLNYQLKNLRTNEVIENLSTTEEKNIKAYAIAHAQETLTCLLQHIAQSYTKADAKITQYLTELDELSKQIETQYPKYKKIATDCIELMRQKDKWSFNEKDSRAVLLEQITTLFAEKSKKKPSVTAKKQTFSSDTANQNTPQKQSNTKNKKVIAQPLSPELQQQLEHIEKALDENALRSETSQAQKTLISIELLNKKFNVLAKGKTTPLLENNLIQVLQQINAQYKTIDILFQKSALLDDLESVKLLAPYIPDIDIFFFADLLRKGNVAICQFMMQNYDQCLFYLNFCALAQSQNGTEMIEKSTILLATAIHSQDSPLLLEMLLQHGANPNYYGATSQNHKGILHLAITLEKEEFVKVCLDNGADPNPDTNPIITKSAMQNPNEVVTKTELRKTHQSLNKQKGQSFANNGIPLQNAIEHRNKAIIALLLQYGASVTKPNEDGFDAIGQETCSNAHKPDKEILTLLIEHGANINTHQGMNDNQSTALLFACQRGCLQSVKMLIELGASPNQQVTNKVQKKGADNQYETLYLPINPLQKALLKGHYDIVDFLMTQSLQPVSFTTAATTFAFYQSNQDALLEPETLCFKLSDSLKRLKKRLTDSFDEKTITLETKAILTQAEHYFLAKQYDLARIYFTAALEFGERTNRHSVLYNIASCHKNCGDHEISLHLYKLCINYAPESPTGQLAAKQLEKLLGTTTKRLH